MPKVLQSRKMWAAIVGLVLMVGAAIANRQSIDPDTLVNSIMVLVSAYMAAVAVEDGLTARAAANATTTTVSTPGESDVTVIAPDTTKPPVVGRTGL